MKVSIIILVYNTGKNLEQSLNSAINQTLKEIEIIVVGNITVNNNLKIIEKCKNSYEHIVVIDMENMDRGLAKNTGLKAAQGEYIFFLDSDDFIINNDVIEYCYSIAKGNYLDIITFDSSDIYDDGKNLYKMINTNNNRSMILESIIINGEEFYNQCHEKGVYKYFLGLNLYNKEFLTNNSLVFQEDIVYEDVLFNIFSYIKAQKVLYVPYEFYFRRIWEESDACCDIVEKKIYSSLKSGTGIYKFYIENGHKLKETTQRILLNSIKEYYDIAINNCDNSNIDKKQKSYIFNYIGTVKKFFKESIENLLDSQQLTETIKLIEKYESFISADEIYLLRGRIEIINGELDRAEELFLRGIQINCENGNLIYYLGMLYELQERPMEAYKCYIKAIKHSDKYTYRIINQKIIELEELECIREYKEEQKLRNSKPKITIITIVYNVKQYIVECIESVLNQSFTDFEWILLDNGCNDGTSDILKGYASKDKRIYLYLNQKNSMIYKTPYNFEYNFHFYNINSEYICYLDSDDYLHKDFLKDLYSIATESDVDIAVGGYRRFNDKTLKKLKDVYPPSIKTKSIRECQTIFPGLFDSFRPMWGKLIKTSIAIEARKIVLSKNLKIEVCGDAIYCLQLLDLSSSLVTTDKILYYYRVRNDSFSASRITKEGYLDDLIIYRERKMLLEKWGELNGGMLYYIDFSLFQALEILMESVRLSNVTSIEEKKEIIKTILSDQEIREIFEKKGLYENVTHIANQTLNSFI